MSPSLRKVLMWIHLCLGLSAGMVVLFLAATGMLLAFQPQVLAWAECHAVPASLALATQARPSLDALAAV